MEDGQAKKYSLFSILGGVVFAAGWWVFIDGYAWGNSSLGCVGDKGALAATQGYAWLPLFGATLFFVGLNGMKWSELRDDGISDPKAAAKAKIFLLFLMLIAVGCIAGSAALMADKFLSNGSPCAWAGISCLLGTLLILLASFVMRVGTLPPADGY